MLKWSKMRAKPATRREVLCPGCGKPMKYNEPHRYRGNVLSNRPYITSYRCAECGWTAPVGEGSTPDEAWRDAYNKAVRRANDE